MGDTPSSLSGQPLPVQTDYPSAHDLVIEKIKERKDWGLEKYNTLLTMLNGRRNEVDALDEVLDLAVYLMALQQEMQYLRLALEERGLRYESLVREGMGLTR